MEFYKLSSAKLSFLSCQAPTAVLSSCHFCPAKLQFLSCHTPIPVPPSTHFYPAKLTNFSIGSDKAPKPPPPPQIRLCWVILMGGQFSHQPLHNSALQAANKLLMCVMPSVLAHQTQYTMSISCSNFVQRVTRICHTSGHANQATQLVITSGE